MALSTQCMRSAHTLYIRCEKKATHMPKTSPTPNRLAQILTKHTALLAQPSTKQQHKSKAK